MIEINPTLFESEVQKEIRTRDINKGAISIQMLFKTIKLDMIAQRGRQVNESQEPGTKLGVTPAFTPQVE